MELHLLQEKLPPLVSIVENYMMQLISGTVKTTSTPKEMTAVITSFEGA